MSEKKKKNKDKENNEIKELLEKVSNTNYLTQYYCLLISLLKFYIFSA